MSTSQRSIAIFTATLLWLAGAAQTIARGTQSISPLASTPTQQEGIKLLAEHFTEVRDADALPDRCKHAFTKLTGETSFSLANPGQRYQATDAMAPNARLPWRRLVFGGFSSDRCVIYYEIGGFVTTRAAVVFDTSGDASADPFVWGGIDGGAPHDVPSLVENIARGDFRRSETGRW